jgi:hypothetical protein
MSMITHGSVRFVDIPEFFLERYTKEIDAWARNIKKIGLVKNFILREGHLADLSPNPEQGAVLIQVKLKCRPWLGGVEICPLEERDERLIKNHCEKLQRAGLPSNAFTKEPERPFLPFMPTVSTRKQ